MSGRSSETGGVPVFSIGGRLIHQRQRLLGMTDEERRWRAQFLKDQHLAPGEPVFSPEYYYATNNIFKRIIRYPLDMVTKLITPVLGKEKSASFRQSAGFFCKTIFAIYLAVYYMKYIAHDWTQFRTCEVIKSRPALLPGDPGYPNVIRKEPHEYYDFSFSKSQFYKGKPSEH